MKKIFLSSIITVLFASLAWAPVELFESEFTAKTEKEKIRIEWKTQSELDNAGLNILRSELKNGKFEKINENLIPGAGTTGKELSLIHI